MKYRKIGVFSGAGGTTKSLTLYAVDIVSIFLRLKGEVGGML